MKSRTDIAQKIRVDIVAGELAFGARLTIDLLSSRYETSHMPVREALRQLAGEGLVVFEPNRGAHVRAINAQFVSELMDLRAGVEAQLARRAAERATSLNIAQLNTIEDTLENHIAAKDYDAILEANREFHDLINSIADSTFPVEVISGHWLLLAALWRQYRYGRDRFVGVANDHRHLIAALNKKDSRAGELIMGAHVMKSKIHLITEMEKSNSTEHPPND